MEDVICNAYTFLEFNRDVMLYKEADNEDRSVVQVLKDWDIVVKDYLMVSQYLSDEAIKKCQEMVIDHF